MKKIVFLLITVFLLAISSVALASNSSVLGKEDKIVGSVLEAITTSGDTYGQISSSFTPELQKKLTADAFSKMKKQIADNYGSLKESKLFTVEKFDKADRLVYLGSFAKQKVVKLTFVFNTAEKVMLSDFDLRPVDLSKQQNK